MKYIMSIDQGTSSSRALIYNTAGECVAVAQEPLRLSYPQKSWVEFDAEAMWQSVLRCMQQALSQSGLSASRIAAIGITNQRETTLVWHRQTGQPIAPAIVWQDRRTAKACQQLQNDRDLVHYCREHTGLLLDSYFSASKIQWILDHVEGARSLAEEGALAFGTVDSFLLWKLTLGQVHATDATNASRTLLYNIKKGDWDSRLLSVFSIPRQVLPEVKDCNAEFGLADAQWLGHAIAITGIVGDQQASAIGQACIEPNTIKSTYGTGCFVLMNTGDKQIVSEHHLLSTVAFQISSQVTYAIEGSIFVAGAATGWLRQGLQLDDKIRDTQALAQSLSSNDGVYFVTALSGLGAPYWQPDARGVMVGLSLDTKVAHLVRAALEAVCYQTKDLLDVLQQSVTAPLDSLKVDGGMVKNEWLLQFLADIAGIEVVMPQCTESTALGAAMVAALGVSLFSSLNEATRMATTKQRFIPQMPEHERRRLHGEWTRAVQCALNL